MGLDDQLRKMILKEQSISFVAKESGIPQPTLQEFAGGRSDGTFPDIRLGAAEKLFKYFQIAPISSNVRPSRMMLEYELKACDITESPEKFKERLIDHLESKFPGMTIDDLLCSPLQAIEYCEQVIAHWEGSKLHESIILKALVNIRKSKKCPTGLKKSGIKRRLRSELKRAYCRLNDTEFRTLCSDCFADMYKSRTIDELLCHPRESLALCMFVRSKAQCKTIPDNLILRTTMNVRKAA